MKLSLREARKKRGLTLREAEKKSGYARNSLSLWENGRPPRIDQLLCMCQVYGIELKDLDLEEWRL